VSLAQRSHDPETSQAIGTDIRGERKVAAASRLCLLCQDVIDEFTIDVGVAEFSALVGKGVIPHVICYEGLETLMHLDMWSVRMPSVV